jgi:hypothetical protein
MNHAVSVSAGTVGKPGEQFPAVEGQQKMLGIDEVERDVGFVAG